MENESGEKIEVWVYRRFPKWYNRDVVHAVLNKPRQKKSLRLKVKLLFTPTRYVVDEPYITYYKQIGDVIYLKDITIYD